MTYEAFFVGVGTTILGVLVGAWVSPRLNYPFQKKLLDHQIQFLKQQADQDARQRETIAKELNEVLSTLRHVLRDLSNHVAGLQAALQKSDKPPTDR